MRRDSVARGGADAARRHRRSEGEAVTTPTLSARIRTDAFNRSTWLEARLQNFANEVEALERELAELLERCFVLSNAQLRHEATCVERDEWKATAQAAQGALDRMRARVAAMDETAESLAIPRG
jgi:DNA repair ATPase RecN